MRVGSIPGWVCEIVACKWGKSFGVGSNPTRLVGIVACKRGKSFGVDVEMGEMKKFRGST